MLQTPVRRDSDQLPVKAVRSKARISMEKILSNVRVGILAVLGLLFVVTSNANTQAAQPTASDFKVTLLGTSTPNPLPDRCGRGTLLEAGDEGLLFECGGGATMRRWQL